MFIIVKILKTKSNSMVVATEGIQEIVARTTQNTVKLYCILHDKKPPLQININPSNIKYGIYKIRK